MALVLSHNKKRMAIVKGKTQPKNELIISRNTKDGLSVSIRVSSYPAKWAVFNVEDILMGLTYVTKTDEQLAALEIELKNDSNN